MGLGQPLRTYGSRYSILKKIYPDFDWENPPEEKEGESPTAVLLRVLKEIFTEDEEFLLDFKHQGGKLNS